MKAKKTFGTAVTHSEVVTSALLVIAVLTEEKWVYLFSSIGFILMFIVSMFEARMVRNRTFTLQFRTPEQADDFFKKHGIEVLGE